ncbi:MAG: NAD-dependent epimerase/dehydratase family protein [Candidatus Zixiibacteriota bacterium]
MSKKVIITGGTGFIGKHLVRLLDGKGYETIVPVRETSDTSGLPKNTITVRASLKNLSPLKPYIEQADYIYHLAGMVRARRKAELFLINTKATVDLAYLTMANKGENFKRFVFVSSQAASRTSEKPIRESESCQPQSSYGESKLKAEEKLLRDFPNLDITIIRPPSVYGPGDKDIFIYFKMGHRGFLPVLGRPDRLISLVHVHDLVRGIVFAAESQNSTNETFYITDCQPIKWIELARKMKVAIKSVSGKNPKIIKIPMSFAKIIAFFNEAGASLKNSAPVLSSEKVDEMAGQWVCDSGKICSLGFEPKIALEEGLKQTYEWYLKNNWLK